MKLPQGVNLDTFSKSKEIVRAIFKDENINIDDITLEILNIVYTHGGDYSSETIMSFAESYYPIYKKHE